MWVYIGTSELKNAYIGEYQQQRNLNINNNSEEVKKSELEISDLELDKNKLEISNTTWSVAELKK
jgi:hypothetical protein